MTDILKYACSAPNCGRKFSTQEALNSHFNLRHPELKKDKDNKTSIEKIINKISKPKLNPQDKHHFLQPITKRKSMTKIVNANNKEIKEDKNKKELFEEDIDIQNIPSFQEEKEKRLLNNLFGQINNLENYLEKDCEFHKEFKLPEVPDYDTMYDSDNEKDNINNKNKNVKENKNNNNNKKDKDKIYEITEEMIFKNNNEINDDKYKNIHELNLSKKNIKIFKDKKNISFEKLSELNILNLSENIISEANDLKYFENLKELYMNNNKIIDISFCEFLPHLTILNLENNNIESITSLSICTKLNILKLSNNDIKYLNSTLRIFKNLKNLEETTINKNPFLSELVSYREYFISNYKNIKKFDEEIITEEKRKSAELFYKENNPLYKNITQRPMSSKPGITESNKNSNINNNIYDIFEENSEDNSTNNEIHDEIISMSKTQNAFRTKEKQIINNNNESKNNNNKETDNNSLIKKEEEKLNKIIKEQNIMIEKLKTELENSSRLNKEYEIKIDQFNNELMINQNNDNVIINNDDEETIKIKKELEMWKKQYFDLLEKNIEKEDKLKFSQDLFDNKKIKRQNPQPKKDIIERPQTAQVRSNLTRDFHKLYEEINILQGNKNIFNDVINEESDEEEDEKEEKEEKEEVNEEEKEENEIKEEVNDEIPDDEIEEMFRKSYQDIQKMRKDLQEINNNMDKNNENKKNNIDSILNEDRKGNKPSLKPIIFKKESNKNTNININKNQNFGRHGNMISGNNKNINEDNKNTMTQRYNTLLYKLKK